jgi:Ca2+-binding RTX toxin-like protein
VIEAANEGIDLVKASVDYELTDFVENLTLTGNDHINGTGNTLANTITGNAGNNIIDGGDGVDKLIGGAGDDTYIVDLVRTGTTATNFKVALQDTITEAANAGNDTVQLRLLSGTDYSTMANATTLTLGTNLENLNASDTGLTKLNLTGNALANTLTGNDANNILNGGAGVDTLIGGLGADSLTGGTGNDYFKYIETEESTANSMDTITDFTVGVDKLNFSELNTAQQLIFTGTSVSANSVWHLQISGDTYVYVDTNGDTVADMEIKLRGNKNLNISDFILPSTPSESSPDGAALVSRMAGEAASDRFTVVGGNNYSYSNPDSILLADGRQLTSWMYVNQSSGAYIHQIYGQFSNDANGHSTNFLIDNLGDRPSMAQLTNGDLVVISESSGIQAQRFNVSGEQVTDSFTVNTYGASPGAPYGGGTQDYAKIAALSSGGYVVVWQSRDSLHPWYTENRPDNFEKGIYAKIFDANDQAISSEFKVNTYINYDQMLPSIAALERDGFIVCWQSGGQDNSTWGIYAQRFDGHGQLIGSEFRVNTTSAGNQTDPAISRISENKLIVVWETEYANTRHIYGQIISADGAMIGQEFMINDSALSSATRENTDANITVLSNGNFVVTWLSYNELYNNIKGQVFNAEGVKTGLEFTVNNNTGLAGVNDFSVAASDEGGFTITWADSLNGNIYSQDFYGTNTIWGDNNANTITLSKTEDSYTILGFSGDDTLIGSDGNDLLNGGADKDILIGGKGNDTYYSTLIDDASRAEYAKLEDTITELPNEGMDTLVLLSEAISNANNNHFEIPENIENIDATAISLNQLKLIGNDSNNIIQSGKSYNEIYAMGGDDVIYINGIGTSAFTGLGNDTVYGSENYDYIVDTTDYSVMGGNDTIYGYGGNDQIQALMGNDFVDGGDGNDIIYAGSYFVTYMIFPQINTFSDNDTVYGGEGNDYIDGGVWGYDYLYGGAGDDTLIGGLAPEAAAYRATGKAYLDGGSGNDHIYGMASDDTIIGGQGRDELTGGSGSDIFKWSAGDIAIVQSISERTDTITDFSVSERDKLDLRDLLSEESASNILNYLDVIAQDDSTIIRISANGSFGSSGAYNATVEDARIVLSGIDLFAVTGTSSEAELIGQMITNQTLLIG